LKQQNDFTVLNSFLFASQLRIVVAFLSVLGKHFVMPQLFEGVTQDPNKILGTGLYEVSAVVVSGLDIEFNIDQVRKLFREKFGPTVAVLYFGVTDGKLWIQFSVDNLSDNETAARALFFPWVALVIVLIFEAIFVAYKIQTKNPSGLKLLPSKIGKALGAFIGAATSTAINTVVSASAVPLVGIGFFALAFLYLTRNRGVKAA
jgi:hypothetical protein